MQLNHYNSKFKPHSFPVVIISDGLSSPFNIGGLFRLGDAFGIERIIFLNTLKGLGKRFKKTSRSAEKYIPYCFEDSFEGVHKELKNKGYQFIILEITSQSQSLDRLSINPTLPIALVVGSENFGVSQDILNTIKTHTHINMYGVNSSMNVVQSVAIALYEITNQLK